MPSMKAAEQPISLLNDRIQKGVTMKKWHLESIIIHDKAKKMSLPDTKRSLFDFHNNKTEMPPLAGKQIGLISVFRRKMLDCIKRYSAIN